MTDPTSYYLDKPGLRLYDELIKNYIEEQRQVFYGTVAYWNGQPNFIGKRGSIYVYSDYKKNEQNQDIAGIKIGDGLAYLIDAPFVEELLYDHIEDNIRHITQAEREFWNNKVRCYMTNVDSDTLIFTTK